MGIWIKEGRRERKEGRKKEKKEGRKKERKREMKEEKADRKVGNIPHN